jgi:hypothetical protein
MTKMSALATIVAIAGLTACGESKAVMDGGTGGSTEGDAGGGGPGAAGRGGSGGGGGAGSGVAGGAGGAAGAAVGGRGGGAGGTGGRGGASGCLQSDGSTTCTGTQVCVLPDCMRAPAECVPIVCQPNTNCCQAAISCTVDGGTGCMSPVRSCVDSPVSFCVDIPANCAGTPTCGCLPSNICTGTQRCVSVSERRVVGCNLP